MFVCNFDSEEKFCGNQLFLRRTFFTLVKIGVLGWIEMDCNAQLFQLFIALCFGKLAEIRLSLWFISLPNLTAIVTDSHVRTTLASKILKISFSVPIFLKYSFQSRVYSFSTVTAASTRRHFEVTLLMNNLQLLQNKAAKLILDRPLYSSATEALSQLGR